MWLRLFSKKRLGIDRTHEWLVNITFLFMALFILPLAIVAYAPQEFVLSIGKLWLMISMIFCFIFALLFGIAAAIWPNIKNTKKTA